MKGPSQVRVTGPLGPYAKGFRAELAMQGYASSSAVNQLKLVAHLSRWMTIEGLSAPELVPVEIERYVAARPRWRGCLAAAISAAPPAGATTPSWSCSCAWGCAPAKRRPWSSMTSTGAVG